ncbi:Aste57867_21731 [Aphanomyces stellatus]|uniref:Aste57867_21731 protein n=1 Tax=Aphanomyces stellatus TaxID=120398 RepID=A0A485LIB1_9STRA|nr:hypothetical protein As57867_021662 [Aphanomyces stellatus]VFT98400.1 Aste57867_21731 [Aphanomyces stellatus]
MALGGTVEASTSAVLGLDIGTTAIKASLVSLDAQIISHATLPIVYPTAIPGEVPVACVLIAVQGALQKLLLADALTQPTAIAICGQMHGIVWWSANDVAASVQQLFDSSNSSPTSTAWSNLISWQDTRCDRSFLDGCRQHIGCGSPIESGYGLASYAHVLQHNRAELAGFDTCGTIMDLVAFIFCGHGSSTDATIDVTNAWSWGGLDRTTLAWSRPTIDALGIPFDVLPAVTPAGTVIGHVSALAARLFHLPSSLIPRMEVYVPMGDHPCSVLALLHAKGAAPLETAMINIGTSAQLALVVESTESSTHDDAIVFTSSFEARPFFFNQTLWLAAALSGGAMFAHFVRSCHDWMDTLSCPAMTIDDTYDRVIAAGLQHTDTTLHCQPTFGGERVVGFDTGLMSNMTTSNWRVGDMSAAVARGIVVNLFQLCPRAVQEEIRRRQLLGSGNALLKNALLQRFVQVEAGQKLVLCSADSDASVGAALLVLRQF